MFFELSDKQLDELKGYIKNYKSEFREKINISGQLKFGCEVEFNSSNNIFYYKDILKDNYSIMYDGSGKDVLEITTPILYNTKKDWEDLKMVLLSIDNACIKNDSGGHIHYDASIVNDDNLVYMLKLWNVFEDIIYKFSTGEFDKLRQKHTFYARKLNCVRDFINVYENDSRSINAFNKLGKYYGLNLTNHLKAKRYNSDCLDTYEVRVPNGSLDITIWQNNVEFFARLFKFANNDNNKFIINMLYNDKKLFDDFKNRLLLADLLYDDEESKIRFLNQFELDKQFGDFIYKK